MPMIGLGTYLLSSAEARLAVVEALRLNYRRIDTAEFYNNHEGIAEGIKESGIARTDLFVTDKLAPSMNNITKGYDETIVACKEHLKRLQTDYLDMYLIHHAMAKDERINQWRALVQLQKEGFVHNIGVSNWSERHIEEIKRAELPLPSLNQIELHPLCTQQSLVRYCRDNNIIVEAYSSLAPATTWRVDPGQASQKTNDDYKPDTLTPYCSTMHLLKGKLAKSAVTEAQILLKWALQHQYPIIPKSSKKKRLEVCTLYTLDTLDIYTLYHTIHTRRTLICFILSSVQKTWQPWTP